MWRLAIPYSTARSINLRPVGTALPASGRELRSGGGLLCPLIVGSIFPERQHQHGDFAGGRDRRLAEAAPSGQSHGPAFERRETFHLTNHADSQFPHNIDIHAVNGPGGGAAVSLVAPGEEKIFRFKTLHPGLYIYQCASPIPSIPAHVANGMYGLLLVEPKHGFPRVDHEFYVFESEFYTQESAEQVLSEPKAEKKPIEPEKMEEKIEPISGKKEGFLDSFVNTFFGNSSESPEQDKNYTQKDLPDTSVKPSFDEPADSLRADKKYVLEFSLEKGLKEQPDYVVFNGRQGALLRQNALRVKVGEKVRIFFGNIGPNGISSFHIIGEIFDQVYLEGAVNGVINRNVQTTLVPSSGTTIVEFTIDVPGDYLLVDHSIFRIDKGAIGLISAVGDDNPEIFESIK